MACSIHDVTNSVCTYACLKIPRIIAGFTIEYTVAYLHSTIKSQFQIVS